MTTWLAEAESLEDIDTCVKIVSTSPSSASSQHQQPTAEILSVEGAATVSKSCDNLASAKHEPPISRSQSCLSLSDSAKYNHVQSKIKQYVEILSDNAMKGQPESSKEEYLQEINSRLVRELEEKNATLQQLQENYEHLLLKYAEAQNKIDNLRFQSSGHGESSRKQKKSYMKKMPKPVVYSYKNPAMNEGVYSRESEVKIDRPSTLAVEPNVRGFEKEGLKAVTPTDSEGMSSVVTSMSGHSKILTNLDEKDEKKPALKSEVLERTLPVFDKVTHWQNSLPPLDMIEKPDTSYFDADTPSTKYNDIALSDLENIPEAGEWGHGRSMSQVGMKKYLRTLSLPSSLTRRNILAQIYKRKNNHTIDVTTPIAVETPPEPEPKPDVPLIQRRRKPPPFIRSASLPIYECDTPRILKCPVPPLDFENLTLSEDETSPQSKEASFLTSHECSFQTLDSLNSCKATLSDPSPASTPRQCYPVHKSTSITPDRSKLFCETGPMGTTCKICGEDVGAVKASSYHGLHSEEKLPLCRSYSSNMVSPTRRFSTDPADFDVFASNLRARSQVTIKALTAHVNNS